MLRRLSSPVLLWAALAGICARGQEKPLNITGTFYTGYYSTTTKGEASQSLSFVPLGARFDMTGYILHPDLLVFSVQPEVTTGPQASEAGIQGGNGIRLQFTLLRKRAFPLTFRYSNLQMEDVYFGSLSRISGYRLLNRNKDLGLTWEFRPVKPLTFVLDWGIGSVKSKSDMVQIPDYLSDQNHINADAKFERKGWDLGAFAHRQEQRSTLLLAAEGEASAGLLVQKVDQLQVAGRKSFLRDSEFYADAGSQSTSSILFSLPIDLSTRYATASARLFQKRRWKTAVRAAYSSNIASQLLAQAVDGLSASGSVAPVTMMLPFSRGISHLNLNATTTATLGYGFGVFGAFDRNQVLSSSAQNGALNSDYFNATGGLTYGKTFQWGSIGGQYGREQGYGSVTGQSGTITGQVYRGNLQRHTAKGLVFDLDVHGANQDVRNAIPLSSKSFASDGSLSFPLIGSFNARLGGGWQRSDFTSGGSDFHTAGYTARTSLEHPRFQVTMSLNDSASNSLAMYTPFLGNLGTGALFLNPTQIIPSDYHARAFSFHANPLRKVEVSANWTHSRQRLDGILNNDFELLNVLVTYHFRKLQVEAGYIRFNQMFSFYPNLARSRFYVRLQRTRRIL